MSTVQLSRPPILDVVGRLSTPEEREPFLTAIALRGHCGIDEPTYATAASIVQRGWQVQGETFNGFKVTWFVIPLFAVNDSQRREFRDELYAMGNRQPFPAISADNYKIELIANS